MCWPWRLFFFFLGLWIFNIILSIIYLRSFWGAIYNPSGQINHAGLGEEGTAEGQNKTFFMCLLWFIDVAFMTP